MMVFIPDDDVARIMELHQKHDDARGRVLTAFRMHDGSDVAKNELSLAAGEDLMICQDLRHVSTSVLLRALKPPVTNLPRE